MPAQSDERYLAQATIEEIGERIRQRKVSPVEVTQLTLDRIERLNPTINAYYTVFAEQALALARSAEAEIAAGVYRGPLHGIPIAIKDIYESGPTTCGSKSLAEYVAKQDCAAVRRLRAAGAIVVGKAATYEFAFGVQTRASHFAPTLNAWDVRRECGGSSSGTAGAIAAGLAYAGMGTCSGGSIRWPAQCCFHVGLKPTYGRVSRAGIYPLAWSLDHPGPLARTVTDAAYMLQGCAGYDPDDPASADVSVPNFTSKLGREIKGMRIGVLRDLFEDGCDPKVRTTFEAALPVFERLGARIVPVPTISHAQLTAIALPLLWSEAGAVHRSNLRQRGGRVQPPHAAVAAVGTAGERRLQQPGQPRARPDNGSAATGSAYAGRRSCLADDVLPKSAAGARRYAGIWSAARPGSLAHRDLNLTGAPAIQVPLRVGRGRATGGDADQRRRFRRRNHCCRSHTRTSRKRDGSAATSYLTSVPSALTRHGQSRARCDRWGRGGETEIAAAEVVPKG